MISAIIITFVIIVTVFVALSYVKENQTLSHGMYPVTVN